MRLRKDKNGSASSIGEKERYRGCIFYFYRDLPLPVTPVATCIGLLWNRRDWNKRRPILLS